MRCFREFIDTALSNPNTRTAYGRAIAQFLTWCSETGPRRLDQIEPGVIARYLQQAEGSEATLKQHLAAIRALFNVLAAGGCVSGNPASPVRAPRAGGGRGRTPILTPTQTRSFIDSIDTSTSIGLRDRAIIGVMVYGFARVGAVVAMRREDYFTDGAQRWFRLPRWNAKHHEIPVHHTAEAYMENYLDGARIEEAWSPLFRTVDRHGELTDTPLTRTDVLRMVKRRARAEGFRRRVSCHTFRASGISAYLENGGTLEHAQAIAGHWSTRATLLYARARNPIPIGEVERIAI